MHPILSCSVLLAAAFVAPGPVPDIIPDGVKGVVGETRVALGTWADGVHVAYSIEKGDTFDAIALRQCGGRARTAELQALNPDIDPKKLRIGQVLWLPPRDGKVKDAPWLYVQVAGPGTVTAPLAANQPLPLARFASYTFFVVPDKKRDGFEKVRPGGYDPLQKFVEAEAIPAVKVPGPPRYVPQDAPIDRIVVTVTLGKDDAGKPTAASERVDYDKAGKVLPKAAEPAKDPKAGGNAPTDPEPKKEWLLLLLALGGGGALWWRARRPALRPALA